MKKAQTDDSKEATLDSHLRSLMILLLGVYLLWINTNISPVDSCNMIRKKFIQESVIRGCKVSTTEDLIPKGNVSDKKVYPVCIFLPILQSHGQRLKTISIYCHFLDSSSVHSSDGAKEKLKDKSENKINVSRLKIKNKEKGM